MIVATAGHIDHGKTRLVRALTGVDTDRLPEEKARGISIDLGFAHAATGGGPLIGFVDVPGHERFVRTMVAGVCGIDFALLVVAADDGVMPQTVEHVHILDLLGLRRGIAVISKVDRVDAARRSEVRAQIDALIAGTTLQGLEVVEASPVTGEGIDAVSGKLRAAAEAMPACGEPGRHFRFAIDRAFSIAGSGTVVTGTVFAGAVAVGDRLRVSPRGVVARVRRLHVNAGDVAQVGSGERCAVNLSQVALADVGRGDWLVAEPIHRPTQRLDAKLRLLPGAPVPGPAARVHLHHGCRDVTARVQAIGGKPLGDGGAAFVHLVADAPLAALHGDRVILRDSAGARTLGGGVVLDPFADVRRRRVDRMAALEMLASADPAVALRALLDAPAGVDLDRFDAMFNLAPSAASALHAACGVFAIGRDPRIGITGARHDAWQQQARDGLAAFHAQHPAVPGMRVEALRALVAPSLPLPAFDAFLQGVASRGMAVRNGVARLTEHDATTAPGDRELWAAVYPLLRGNGTDLSSALPRRADLARAARVDPRALTELLHRRRVAGAVHRVGSDRFCLRTTLAQLASTAATLAAASADGSFTVAQFRDAIGSGRLLAIEVLECLDGVGATRRVGEVRRIRDDHLAKLGGEAEEMRVELTRDVVSTSHRV